MYLLCALPERNPLFRSASRLWSGRWLSRSVLLIFQPFFVRMLSRTRISNRVEEPFVPIHSRVSLRAKLLFQVFQQLSFYRKERRIDRQIMQAFRIFPDAVEFLGRPLSEGHRVVVVKVPDDVRFCRTVIDVPVARLRVAGGPPVGIVIADVQEFFR